jgi:multimeric flavodoxin WrbA
VIDDVVNEFRAKALEADGFIFGSPVHYASASGNMTAFMDRLFYSGGRDFYLKPAAAVTSARRAGTTATFDQLNKYFTISQMPLASSCYWNMIHGSKPGEAAQDPEGIRTMRTLAKNMAFLMKAVAARKETSGLPEPEPFAFTNFIR